MRAHLDLLQSRSRTGPTFKLGKHTPRHRRLDEMEMWIEHKGLMEIIPRLFPLPQAVSNHSGVKEKQGIPCAQTQGLFHSGPGIAKASVLVIHPGKCIVGIDVTASVHLSFG